MPSLDNVILNERVDLLLFSTNLRNQIYLQKVFQVGFIFFKFFFSLFSTGYNRSTIKDFRNTLQ